MSRDMKNAKQRVLSVYPNSHCKTRGRQFAKRYVIVAMVHGNKRWIGYGLTKKQAWASAQSQALAVALTT